MEHVARIVCRVRHIKCWYMEDVGLNARNTLNLKLMKCVRCDGLDCIHLRQDRT